ncbi:MAG: DUF1080 domain-containing protein [Candidatus Hydrogenedens sp.]|nr:DUF1080 domain-containing protein [Candidatus Hydrogenedens sp.]
MRHTSFRRLLLAALVCCAPVVFAEDGEWIQLFNGKDLEGWTPKIRGQEYGEDKLHTFRVEDGLLTVSYDEYGDFDGQFGHLFWKDSYSKYKIRVEYRFVGDQCAGGADWAYRNSGIMVHGQDPKTMRQNQEFPVSVEVQLLGGDGEHDRTTANMCSPGTHIEMDGKLKRQHCINSDSDTYAGDQWVTVEVEVHGNDYIRHAVNGKTVMEYQKPQLDDRDGDGKTFIKDGDPMLSEGTISIQSESHPVQFRKIELMPLED